MPLENTSLGKYKDRFLCILALHIDSLTHRNLLGRLDFMEGALGFGSGILRALAGLRKIGPLHPRVTLQGLVLLDKLLELLLNLANLGLLLLALGVLLGRFFVGLGQRLFEGRHLGRGP